MIVNGIQLLPAHSLGKKSVIREGFELIKGQYGRIITIIDDNEILLGLVTQGMLRRAILAGFSLSDRLIEIMEKNPVLINSNHLLLNRDFSYLFSDLNKKGITVGSLLSKIIRIPVVDDSQKLLGLVTTEILETVSTGKDVHPDPSKMNFPHVLVVGGAGYIGSILVEMMLLRGWKTTILDNLIYNSNSLNNFMKNKDFTLIKSDVENISSLIDSVDDIDCVVYLAEIVGDPSCAYLPSKALETNFLSVSLIATICSHLNINRFIYASSCSVYGLNKHDNILLNENSELNPVSHYARMKVLSEQILFNQLNPMFCPTILRLATVFGYSFRPRFDLVVNTLAKNAYYNGSIQINGGDQWRPYVHVKDVSRVIIRALESPMEKVKKEIINVGSNSNNYTLKQLSKLVKNVFPDCKIRINEVNTDKRSYKVDFNKVKDIFDYEPKISVNEGLNELKNIFENGLIEDPNDKMYSNIDSLIYLNENKKT